MDIPTDARLVPVFVIFLVFIAVPIHSQTQNLHIQGSYNSSFMLSGGKPEYGVLGSPYLNDQFMFGAVRMKDGSSMETLIRYNIYNKSLEVISGKDTLELVKAFTLQDFTINRRRFIYCLYTEEEFNTPYLAADFFEVLVDNGELELLRQHRMDIETNIAISNYMGGVGDGRDYFVHRTTLFIQNGKDKTFQELDVKKKEFLNLFGDKRDKVEYYIQKEGLKLTVESDLLKIINYYNSMDS